MARNGGDPDEILELIERGLVRIPFRLTDEVRRVRQLRCKYRDLPMSLADACVVRLVELTEGSRVLTFDTHFRAYRQFDRTVIPVLMPPAGG